MYISPFSGKMCRYCGKSRRQLCLSLFREQVKHLQLLKCLSSQGYISCAVSNMDDFLFQQHDDEANQPDCQLWCPLTSQEHTRRALVMSDHLTAFVKTIRRVIFSHLGWWLFYGDFENVSVHSFALHCVFYYLMFILVYYSVIYSTGNFWNCLIP